MAAPKCRLCGHIHWTYEPHVFDTPVKPVNKPVDSKQSTVYKVKSVNNESLQTENVKLRKRIAELTKEVEDLRNQANLVPKTDRKQYMKEYMARRRLLEATCVR